MGEKENMRMKIQEVVVMRQKERRDDRYDVKIRGYSDVTERWGERGRRWR